MMVTCSICKKSFKNTQGLRGHNFFVHTNNGDLCAEPAAQLAEQSSGFSLAPVSTEHRLSSLEQRLTMLEQATGVLQPDLADKVSSSSRKPLLEQMAELTEQLGKLARQLDSLDTSHNSMRTALGDFENQLNTKADQEMLSHLQTGISLLEKWEGEIDKLLVTMPTPASMDYLLYRSIGKTTCRPTPKCNVCVFDPVCPKDTRRLNPPESISRIGMTGWESGATDHGSGGGIMS